VAHLFRNNREQRLRKHLTRVSLGRFGESVAWGGLASDFIFVS
jgi:hypothetical protein